MTSSRSSTLRWCLFLSFGGQKRATHRHCAKGIGACQQQQGKGPFVEDNNAGEHCCENQAAADGGPQEAVWLGQRSSAIVPSEEGAEGAKHADPRRRQVARVEKCGERRAREQQKSETDGSQVSRCQPRGLLRRRAPGRLGAAAAATAAAGRPSQWMRRLRRPTASFSANSWLQTARAAPSATSQ